MARVFNITNKVDLSKEPPCIQLGDTFIFVKKCWKDTMKIMAYMKELEENNTELGPEHYDDITALALEPKERKKLDELGLSMVDQSTAIGAIVQAMMGVKELNLDGEDNEEAKN